MSRRSAPRREAYARPLLLASRGHDRAVVASMISFD
jgi:hypothetical protein